MSGTGPSPRKMTKIEHESYGSDEEAKEFDEDTQKAVEEIEDTRKAVEELELCQTEIETFNDKAIEEILIVEQKFTKLQKPYFDKRSVVIERIPKFWVTAILNHPQISLLIDEDEEDCLNFLNKLEVDESEDIKSGYRIKLFFEENPFFENDVLVKEFHFRNVENPVSTSSEIKWKKGMNLTKQRSKTRYISKRNERVVETQTLFSWFSDNEDPSNDDIAEIIKEQLWLNPLSYYLVPDDESESSVDEEGSEEGEEDDGWVAIDEEDNQVSDKEDEDQKKTAEEAESGEAETL